MDKNYPKLKSEAIKLREKGLSYNEIKKEINVSKSTLSFWLKIIPLTPEQRERLYTKRVLNLARGSQSQKERRIREIAEIIKNAEREISSPLSFEAYRLFGAALYWAEGNKASSFAVTNSDPCFMLFMVQWFEKVFGVPPEELTATLNIYPQQNESEIKQFWSQLTGIPIENFRKSFIKPPNKEYKKNNLYYGTMKIRVPKGTDMRHQVFGWVKAVMKDIEDQTGFAQREWRSLREVPRPINIPEDINCPASLIGKAAGS